MSQKISRRGFVALMAGCGAGMAPEASPLASRVESLLEASGWVRQQERMLADLSELRRFWRVKRVWTGRITILPNGPGGR